MWTVKGIYPAVSITSAYTTNAGQSSCITMKHITGPFTDSCNALHVWISVTGKGFVTRQRLVGGALTPYLSCHGFEPRILHYFCISTVYFSLNLFAILLCILVVCKDH